MVRLVCYNIATGHLEEVRRWPDGFNDDAAAYREIEAQQDHCTDHVYYIQTEVFDCD